MTNKSIYLLSLLILAAGCQKNEEINSPVQKKHVLHAFIDSEKGSTKTAIKPIDEKNCDVVWQTGDEIVVFLNGQSSGHKYMLETGDGSSSGTFTGEKGEGPVTSIAAYYPYGAFIGYKSEEDTITGVTVNQTQLYQLYDPATGYFHIEQKALPMAARQSSSSGEVNSLYFRNVCGVLQLRVKGSDAIRQISIRGNNGEAISGGAKITWNSNEEPILHMIGKGDYDQEVLLYSETAVDLKADEATSFCIVLPPVTFSKGFQIILTDAEGGMMVKRTEKPVTIHRSKILPMAAFSYLPPKPEANQIFYTTTDGTAVDNPSNCGTVNSNVYSDGRGVITFSENLTTIGTGAFNSSSSSRLKSVILPEGITTIGAGAFSYQASLYSVILPESLEHIIEQAFIENSSLTSITIPSEVKTIQFGAFGSCSNLKTIYCKAVTPPSGVSGMFDAEIAGRRIYVPKGSVETYKNADGWKNYAADIVGYDFPAGN